MNKEKLFSKNHFINFYLSEGSLDIGKLIKKILLVFSVSTCSIVTAQDSNIKSGFIANTDFKVGYTGNILWDNGLYIGAEYLWKEKIRTKERKKGDKDISHQLILNGSLSFSTNFNNKTDRVLTNHYGIIWRRTNSKNRQINIEFNPLGYQRTLLPTTYEVKGDKVTKVFMPGRMYYTPSMAIGIGRFREGKKRTGWNLNLRYSMRMPYNGSALSMIALEYGHRFNFKSKK